MGDIDKPTSVTIEMGDRSIPESKVQEWVDEWESFNEVSRSMYDSKQDFIDGKALEFVQRMFTQAGREADHHYWVENWGVVHGDDER